MRDKEIILTGDMIDTIAGIAGIGILNSDRNDRELMDYKVVIGPKDIKDEDGIVRHYPLAVWDYEYPEEGATPLEESPNE